MAIYYLPPFFGGSFSQRRDLKVVPKGGMIARAQREVARINRRCRVLKQGGSIQRRSERGPRRPQAQPVGVQAREGAAHPPRAKWATRGVSDTPGPRGL